MWSALAMSPDSGNPDHKDEKRICEKLIMQRTQAGSMIVLARLHIRGSGLDLSNIAE